ncbi:MAG: hypothetical protein QGF46_01580 [Planctomycetota bacterium]|nr:hypothetical protein [Planctomycetota bacterium]
MAFEYSITDYSELLSELLARVIDDPKLKDDLHAAKNEFSGGAELDSATANSFNEWFLLERDCPLLGAPPAVAWAPTSIEKDDIWDCLLNSFFGLFHVTEIAEDEQSCIGECLWSARQVRLSPLIAGIETGTFIPARVAQANAESHLLLPSASFIVAPDLVDSLAEDLRNIRGAQPRSRLSQLEWHRLFSTQAQSQTTAQSMDDALAAALAGQDEVTVDYVKTLVANNGVGGALDQLAFDTDLDLEAVRVALALSDFDSDASTNDDDVAESVIDDFLSKTSNGVDINSAFDDLESKLNLDEGSTNILSEESEETGVDDIPGFEMWLRSYLFDCEIQGSSVSPESGKEIEAFLNYCAQSMGQQHLDPHQLMPSTVLAYMMGATDLNDLQAKVGYLDDFVMWLVNEQDAPLQDIVPLSGDETNSWLQDLIACNTSLQTNGAEANSLIDVSKVSPLQTLDESGVAVEVVGFPGDYLSKVQIGDKLMGSWKDGAFIAAAWMPQRLLPVN